MPIQSSSRNPLVASDLAHAATQLVSNAVQGPTTALSEPYLNDITVFDVNTHTWHTPDVEGARPPVRDSHAAVALGDRMVIYGGDCGKEYLSDVWAYHVQQQKWQAFKVQPMLRNFTMDLALQ